MRYFIYFICCALIIAGCKQKKTNLSGDKKLKPVEFIAAFKPITTTITITDSSLVNEAESDEIAKNALQQFIPDSIINAMSGKNNTASFIPYGRIEKPDETYLLLIVNKEDYNELFVIVLDGEDKYAAYKLLLNTAVKDSYNYSLSINREPTFTISKEKPSFERENKFTRLGWTYNSDLGFVVAVKESNEFAKLLPLINPIDTLPKINKWSGNYMIDARNYIAIRDAKTTNNYLFFLHVEKNDGACIGELKGTIKLIDSTHAIYQFAGDPCIINFTYNTSSIDMMEKGSCGNRRGMDCRFEDKFPKAREVKTKSGTKSIITSLPGNIPVANSIGATKKDTASHKLVPPVKKIIPKKTVPTPSNTDSTYSF